MVTKFSQFFVWIVVIKFQPGGNNKKEDREEW